MLRRLSLSAALAALAVPVLLTGPASAEPGVGTPAYGSATVTGGQSGERSPTVSRRAKRAAQARADDDTPLAVTIDQLTPSTIPARGLVRVSGTVTNDDTEAWATINIRPFISLTPMVSSAQIAAAADTPPDAVVGERVNDPSDQYKGFIEELAPGESQTYTMSIPVRLLRDQSPGLANGEPGVYWFGVHALGEGPDGRDDFTDGRARTFLPMVPESRTGRLPTAVVIPLRRQLVQTGSGAVDDLATWTTALSREGRLRSLVDFGASSGDRPVTWVVDPALIDAVRRIAQGNPGRSLDANLDSDENDGEDTPTDAATEPPPADPTPTEAPAEGAEPAAESPLDLDSLDPVVQAAADAAQSWLTRLGGAIGPEDEVLSLPYGDVDVAGAAAHDPELLRRAVARAGTTLPGYDVTTAPVVSSPGGFLSPGGIDLADPASTMLLTDTMFDAPAPPVADVDGHRAVVFSTGAAAGGPGPESRTGTIAMRQRLLSEAAVRFLRDDPAPLTMMLPHDWSPAGGPTYFGGLDVPWLDLSGVADVAQAAVPEPVEPSALRYPGWQEEQELDQAAFDAADELIASGVMLQNLLTLNNLVAGTVTDQALGTLSYSARTRPIANRASAIAARSWINARVGQIAVSSSRAVTLSSASGRFQATISNALDQPVTVSLDAMSDRALDIQGPARVDVPAKGRQTVLLTASTDESGIHEVTLLVTDKRGTPLGPRTQLTIRSAQVSNVIWAFIGVGAALLFGAIGLRLFRRIRGARRTPDAPAAEPDAESEREPAGAGTR